MADLTMKNTWTKGTYTISHTAAGVVTVTVKLWRSDGGTSYNNNASNNFYITIAGTTYYHTVTRVAGTTGVTFSSSKAVSLSAAGTASVAVSVGGSLSGTTFQITGNNSTTYSITNGNKATYKVTFNANGGSGAPAAQTKTYGVNLTLSSTKPTRSGYTFLGWSTSSSATTATYAAGGTYTANAAVTLYAVWEVNINASTYLSMATNAILGSNIRLDFANSVSTNYNVVKLTSGSKSYTVSEKPVNSVTIDLPESTFASWFATDSNEVAVTATITVYNSSNVVQATINADFTLIMPESIGAPKGKVKGVITSKMPLSTTINLLQNLEYKHGATFDSWHVTCSSGEVTVMDDIVTFTRPSVEDKTTVVYVRAVDTRGFMSDMTYIYCYVRKKGFCVYDSANGGWKQVSPYVFDGFKYKRINGSVYFNGRWKKLQGVVEGLPELEGASYLTDEFGNILTDENGNYLIMEEITVMIEPVVVTSPNYPEKCGTGDDYIVEETIKGASSIKVEFSNGSVGLINNKAEGVIYTDKLYIYNKNGDAVSAVIGGNSTDLFENGVTVSGDTVKFQLVRPAGESYFSATLIPLDENGNEITTSGGSN